MSVGWCVDVMVNVFSPEIWDAEGKMYVFRCYPAARIERWTFRVQRATLEKLEADGSKQRATAFDRYKDAIYDAAIRRMRIGDPEVEHVLILQDFHDAVTALG